MAATSSMTLPLGTLAPDFSLPDVTSGKIVSRTDLLKSKGLLVMFICCHCPFVKHLEVELARIGQEFVPQGLSVIAISSNDALNYPEDSPDKLQEMASRLGFCFPYLYDESQAVAKAYQAVCTPDFFLFDHNHHLAYRGQLDDSRPGNSLPVTGTDLRAAINAVLTGSTVNPAQKPSIGCGIKWKR